MERLGNVLKTARLEKGLTLAEVEKETNIRRDFIEAMEAEDWACFSEYVYLKSFLRTYCRYLGLANRESLYFLIDELKPKPIPPKVPEEINLITAPCRQTKIIFIILALVILGTTSYFYKQYLDPVLSLGKAPLENEYLLPGQPETIGEVEPEVSRPVEEITMFRLDLKCLDDQCWVEVKNSEGEFLYRALMAKGDEIGFANLQKVTLKLGNAGQMLVLLNGQPLATLGEIGAVVTRTYELINNEIIEF